MNGTDWGAENPNDPYLRHQGQMNTRSVRQAGEAREMTNPASDPFMVNQLRGMANRPRVKVRIVAAAGLPERGSNKATYATCMAKNKKSSMFRTRDAWDTREPIWDEPGGQMVMRWVPGDVLLFRVMDKDRSGCVPGLMDREVLVGQCELRADEYFPNGLQANLPLVNATGYPMSGAELRVEVVVYGVGDQTLGSKFSRMCNCMNWDARTIRRAIEHAPEAIIAQWYEILGEPADDRTKGDLGMLIMIPCFLFIFITWTGWLLMHVNAVASAMINGFAFCISLGLMVMGVTTHKKSKLPFFAIGCLMLIAIVMGMVFTDYGWNQSWRQWWWMHTGHSLGASAGTPAEARSDASVLTFNTVKNGTAWTSVDASRAAGYRHGDIYCAAPILDPTVALGDIMRVEFWAIGINCCDDFGSFTCDSAREISGGVGVIMKGGGMPCSDCHANEFRLAALKAAGVNRMVSAPGALYMRYVSTATTIENLYLSKCVFSFFWSLIIGIFFFGLLGFLTNYKGWGKPGHFPLYNLLVPKKRSILPPPEMEAKQQPIIDDGADKQWTLVLSPSKNNQWNVAAVKSEDQSAVNYATC